MTLAQQQEGKKCKQQFFLSYSENNDFTTLSLKLYAGFPVIQSGLLSTESMLNPMVCTSADTFHFLIGFALLPLDGILTFRDL